MRSNVRIPCHLLYSHANNGIKTAHAFSMSHIQIRRSLKRLRPHQATPHCLEDSLDHLTTSVPGVIEKTDDVLRLLSAAGAGTEQRSVCHLPLISTVKLQGGFKNAMAKLRFGGKAKKAVPIVRSVRRGRGSSLAPGGAPGAPARPAGGLARGELQV